MIGLFDIIDYKKLAEIILLELPFVDEI